MSGISLGKKIISEDMPCYIIAEMSANHAGKLEYAKEIIYKSKEAGANCIKTQTYTADTITLNSDKEYFLIDSGTWKGEKLYDLYKKAYTPWEWMEELKYEAEKIGLDFLSTVYDKTSVDFLEGIGTKFYKISSFELNDIPLLEYVGSKNKPIIMSVGMGTFVEIKEAIDTINRKGNSDICILKCCSAYPPEYSDMNLLTIPDLKEKFRCNVGLSDHSITDISALTAVSLGAKVIEKHICLSRDIKTPDSAFSLEPREFKNMVDNIRNVEMSLGHIEYGVSKREKYNTRFKKSIFASKDIKQGDVFTTENIKVVRPKYGISPKYYNLLLGKQAEEDISFGEPIKLSH